EIDFHEIAVAIAAVAALFEIGGAAGGGRLVGRAHDVHQGDELAVAALADFDVLFMMLFAHHRREQGLFVDVVALGHARTVAVHEAGQQDLIKTVYQLMLKAGPKIVVFQVRIHSWKRAGHCRILLGPVTSRPWRLPPTDKPISALYLFLQPFIKGVSSFSWL